MNAEKYMNTEKNIIIYKAGVMVILTLAICYMLSSVLFLAGFSLSSYLFPLSFAISAICVLRKSQRKYLISLGIALVTMLLSVAIMILTVDFSFDGNAYHQLTIVELMNGWNPFRNPNNDAASVWGIHYARAFETISASIALTFGHLEWGRAVNPMLILGTGLMAYPTLRSIGVRYGASIAITLLLMANPIGMEQLFTYLNDFPKYYYVVIAIILLIRIFRHPTLRPEAMLCAVLILGIGTKFNAAPDLAITMIFAIVLAYVRRRSMLGATIVAVSAVALIAGILLFGYNPYITNIISKGHPLYPLIGEGAIDIMTLNTPPAFLSGNRFTNFFLSLSSAFFGIFPGTGLSISGFTFFMPLLLILSVAVFIVGRRRIAPVWWAAAATVFLSCFLFEQSWWARYIAQLWLLPMIAAVCAAKLPCKTERGLFICICVCGAGAVAYSSAYGLQPSILFTQYRSDIFNAAREKGELTVSETNAIIQRRVKEENLKVRILSPDSPEWDKGYVYYFGYSKLEPTVRVLMPLDKQREMHWICDW